MNEKLLFASDIHGSAFWCEKLAGVIEREKPTRICLLGDLLYHGPRNPLPDGYAPQEVARILNGYKDSVCAVRGNCDAEVDQLLIEFPMRADYALLSAFGKTFYLTHGHLNGEENPPPLKGGSVLVNGHTHEPCRRELASGIIYLNCGSVALPKGTPHSCLVIENGVCRFIDLASGEVFSSLPL
ncbi:MAG: phosphodiesterase [Clostridia bacterium]|nr:phosphodiesterase [Clostridia bacterium]